MKLYRLLLLSLLAVLALLPSRNTQAYMANLAFMAPAALAAACVPGTTWVTSTTPGVAQWKDIESSLDGTKLSIIRGNTTNIMYTSTDSGATWVSRTLPSTGAWLGIASSADGLSLAATRASTNIMYTSTDGGATWVSRTLPATGNYKAIASSADGTKLVTANGSGGYIYTSTDRGATWVSRTAPGATDWRRFASSDDGTKLVVGDEGSVAASNLWNSTDSGATWTKRGPKQKWTDFDSSADGTKFIAAGNNTTSGDGAVFTSTDSGVNWVTSTWAGVGINGAAISADGSKYWINTYTGYVYSSTNGTSWTSLSPQIFNSTQFTSLAASYNGNKLVVANGTSGSIYTSTCANNPFSYNWGTSTQHAKVKASTPQNTGYFGSSVALYGDTAAIGAGRASPPSQAGAVYIFTGSGTTWTQQTSFTIPSAAASDRVASDAESLALENGTLAVGVAVKDKVYVYTGSGSTWTLQQIVSDTATANYSSYGRSVALSSDTMVVGAGTGALGNGRAFFYARSGGVWTKQGVVLGNDDMVNLGTSVDVDGDTAILGEPGHTGTFTYQGGASIYTRSGSTWTLQQRLLASDPAVSNAFGTAVSISSNTAVVGATSNNSSTGAVYVYTRSGSTWTQQQKLTASDASTSQLFGSRVKLEGDTIAITGGITASPKVYIFQRDGSTWIETKKITAVSTTNRMGEALSLTSDKLLIGEAYDDTTQTDSGAAYIYGAP